jgi:hypothetical protein
MDSDQGAAFAAVFHGNRSIQTLILRKEAFTSAEGALSFVEALPQDHSLEVIVLEYGPWYTINNDSWVRIVRSLCSTPLKALSLIAQDGWYGINQEGCERIVQILKMNKHSFIKLDLFLDSQDSPWQNEIRLQIDLLTRKNRFQLEKETWVAQFLQQDAHTQELLFRTALERANKVDNEEFSSAPNMLFYLIRAVPDLIAQAIRDGH